MNDVDEYFDSGKFEKALKIMEKELEKIGITDCIIPRRAKLDHGHSIEADRIRYGIMLSQEGKAMKEQSDTPSVLDNELQELATWEGMDMSYALGDKKDKSIFIQATKSNLLKMLYKKFEVNTWKKT